MSTTKGFVRVQQAIFSSAKTDRASGYHILAASSGINEFDRRELASWGPSHDSLLDSSEQSESVNFFPLPSGSFCVSRTTPAGSEYSGRGRRIYTHGLIASPETMRQFDNHPFLLLRAALAQGAMEPLDNVPPRLDPLELPEPATADRAGHLAILSAEVGAGSLALLMQAALTNVCLALRGTISTARLVGGLVDCLPIDCRTSVSFSTGLKYSTRRTFDWIALPEDAAQQRWLAHRSGLVTLDLARTRPTPNLLGHAWARLVHRVLAADGAAFLSEELAQPRADFTLAGLAALGTELLERFEADSVESPKIARSRQAHAAHCKFQKSFAAASGAVASAICAPSEKLDAESPHVVARLEALDDAVFDAIQGKSAALADLHRLWPALKTELGETHLAESREQYIRYALSIWQEPSNIAGDHDPARAVHALEVLCVLFDEVR